MQVLSVFINQILIPPERQRKEFSPEQIVSLATSIESTGLIHPVIVRKAEGDYYTLVAGERRLRALDQLWNLGEAVRCGGQIYLEQMVPCIDQGSLTDLEAYEMELSENIERVDLNWQDKARATSQFLELRRLQAEKSGSPPPTHIDIATELRPESTRISAIDTARKEVILSKHLNDLDVQAAPSLDAAFKIVKRKEELKASTKLGEMVGKTYNKSIHTLVNTDCLTYMRDSLSSEQFDCILTDPPYGMGADEFGDSGGKAQGEHFYQDNYATWEILITVFAKHSFRLAKPQAHAYIFCDIENFQKLRNIMSCEGWTAFRTPLIWHNPTSNRAPWPEQGPMRKWQAILYAVKGKKLCNRLAPDLITFSSDPNLNHQAQKPVALFKELLSRSTKPGDSVLDPFCGTGPIFPAAHELKLRAVGLELDPAAYGIAVARVEKLK